MKPIPSPNADSNAEACAERTRLLRAQEIWLAKPAPRYTSYPPAPTFRDKIKDYDFAASVSAIPADAPVSLYLHIPFCRQLCLYCGCHTSVTQGTTRLERYVEAIKHEVRLLAALHSTPRKLSHLHFGGGTPNILSDHALTDLFAFLFHAFDGGSCQEIAMELDPRTLTKSQAETLAACGVSRVSLGVQDFQPDVQEAVNRVQPYALVEKAFDRLFAAGIQRINFDLMYGLPLQTPTSVADTARLVSLLGPDRIALFSYAHVPQMKKHQQALEAYGLPDKDDLLAMEAAARAVFVEAGYLEIGMDHFARADDALLQAQRDHRLRRNFQGYTDDNACALLGVGASSISQTPDGFYQNERDVAAYQDLVHSGQLAVVRGIRTTSVDRLRAEVIEELMCYLAVDLAAVCTRHKIHPDTFAPELAQLQPYADAGIVELTRHHIRLATPYRMAIRVIAQVFDRYAATPAASRAV